jgi:hypothetical protein
MSETMQVKELQQRLGVPYRLVRYVLEENHLPLGVERNPSRGRHRQLTTAQAFWLGLVLKLSEAGIAAPRAAVLARQTQELLTGAFAAHTLDPHFDPFGGKLVATLNWYVEVAEGKRLRITAEPPSQPGRQYHTAWAPLAGLSPESVGDAEPVVLTRINLSRMAELLQGEAAADRRPAPPHSEEVAEAAPPPAAPAPEPAIPDRRSIVL